MTEFALIESPASSVARARPPASVRPERPALEILWARHDDEVRAAQRLRWRVFADEMGARLQTPPGTPAGHDADRFDAHCEHLLVRAVGADGQAEVVGTYRVLMPSAARCLGGYYTETEFDLAPLDALRPRLAEFGRSCVHPAWRQGVVMLMMWARLTQLMEANGIEAVIGCASMPMNDGGRCAAALWRRLERSHGVPASLRVHPRLPLPVDALDESVEAEPPALIKGYLKSGARVLGEPAWDPDFNTADLPMMLRLSELAEAHRRRFLGA